VSISIRCNPIRRSRQDFWRDQAGFTLIELILALLIFSIISASIFATFAAISKGVENGRGSADFYHVGRAAMRQIDRELQAAFQFSVPDRGGTIPSYVREPFKGEDETAGSLPRDRVIFLTIPFQRFPENAARNELCQVCYAVANNVQGVPALFRYEDCALGSDDDNDDEDRCSGKQEPLELTDAIVGLDVTYYDQEGEEHAEWPPSDASDSDGLLPCQARVTLFLQQGEQPVRSLTTTVAPQMRGNCEPKS
jgi:prepilin-type N-terminal cleavage/methylation domain-containing protein